MNKTIHHVKTKKHWSQLVVVVLAAATFAGCTSNIDGDAAIKSADIPAYQSETSKRKEDERRAAEKLFTITACISFRAKMDTALEKYNEFIDKLNTSQSYSGVNGADGAAVGALNDLVSTIDKESSAKAIDPKVSAAMRDLANLARELSGKLAAKDQNANGINTLARRWIDSAKAVDIACPN